VRTLASIVAVVALANGAPPPAALTSCHSARAGRGESGPAKDEVWLGDEAVRRLNVSTEEVGLHDVDETVMNVGPVVAGAECPIRLAPQERRSCIVVTVEQAALGRIRVGGAATARSSALVHDVLPGEVAWIAGTLDATGRTARIACLFADPMAELRPGRQIRVEVVVGSRPAFAISRVAVLERRGESFVFVASGTSDDGRRKFTRVPVRVDGDTGGPWLPVADLQPGSLVVKSGTEALASMLTVTTL